MYTKNIENSCKCTGLGTPDETNQTQKEENHEDTSI